MRTIQEICDLCQMSEGRMTAHAKTDFPFFLKNVLGAKLSAFHYDQTSLLWGPKGLNRFVEIISPRGHLKTTLFSNYYPAWRMFRETDYDIALSSGTMDQGKKILSSVQEVMLGNELLKDLVPQNRFTLWNKTEISTATGVKMFVKPFNSSIRGTHVDLYIMDDVLRDLENMTQDQAKDIFWGIAYPTVQTRKGQMVVVGTPQTIDDLLAELAEKEGWVSKRYAAAQLDDQGNLINPLWPENFTIAELLGMRLEQGPLRFDREYLCNPLGGGSSIFPDDLIKAAMKSTEVFDKKKGALYFLGMDMAISMKESADWTVLTMIEKDRDGRCWMRLMKRIKTDSQKRMMEEIKALNNKYGLRKILIEDVGLSQGLVVDCLNDPDIKFITEGFKTGRVSKEELISHLQSGMQTGNLYILDNPILIKELKSFGIKKNPKTGKQTLESLGGHDDTVMSLALAYYAASVGLGGVAHFDWV